MELNRIRLTTIFQSTPSVGRATSNDHILKKLEWDFNPRPPWGGRPSLSRQRKKVNKISIHALRGEGDIYQPATCGSLTAFQSTPSVGRATISDRRHWSSTTFQSTPSVGRATRDGLKLVCNFRHFNPRPPWGGRPIRCVRQDGSCPISIHALRGEGDFLD